MKRGFLLVLLLSALLLVAWPRPTVSADPAAATVILVTTETDEVDVNGECSLREAVSAANTDTAIDACAAGDGADIIVLPAGTFHSSMYGELPITESVKVLGVSATETIVDGSIWHDVFHLPDTAEADVTFESLWIRGGDHGIKLSGSGSLELSESRISDNQSDGVFADPFLDLDITIRDSRVDHNGGRGIDDLSAYGEMLIVNSLIDDNNDGGIAGGISPLTMINSTISRNSTDRFGGGLYLHTTLGCTATSAHLYNVTIAYNSADMDRDNYGSGGGLFLGYCEDSTVELKNTILANNYRGAGDEDCDGDGVLVSRAFNLLEAAGACTLSGDTQGLIIGVDPELGSLSDNGGPTHTHALLPTSPAIDAGNPLACVGPELELLTEDQRGFPRPLDGDDNGSARCDIGAYEYEYVTPPPENYVLTVDRVTDTGDNNPGDGRCDGSVNAGDQCSLRAAIEELNALGRGLVSHEIRFAIPGTGPFVIAPQSPLPAIDVPVNILGQSQSGASCPSENGPADLLIVLNGSAAGSNASGLHLSDGADWSAISGLVIGNFGRAGIFLQSHRNEIYCNVLGLSADGIAPAPNQHGIYADSFDTLIGATIDTGRRNVISGNLEHGVHLVSGAFNTVAGNYIGTTADGLAPAGNDVGVFVDDHFSLIQGNVVSGNETGLVAVENSAEIFGNTVGLAASGDAPLANQQHGIVIDSFGHVIGGPGRLANRIASNGGDGVRLMQSFVNSVRYNEIFDNGGLGIDLGDNGVTANDAGDVDGWQNFPVLTARPAGYIVDATLNSKPDTSFTVDVFRSTGCDPSNHGEGEEYMLSGTFTTDNSGQVDFELDLRGEVSGGDFITATATEEDGSTSEFSACVQVGARNGLTLTVNRAGDEQDHTPGDGVCDTLPNLNGEQCSLRAALQEANALGAAPASYRIEFDIAAGGVITISPAAPLPPILVPLELDGASQPGANCPTVSTPAQLRIVLDGSEIAGPATGLIFGSGSDGSLVRGLVVGHFDNQGIALNSSGNTLACSHIGIGADGVTPLGNGFFGVRVNGADNVIGGGSFANRRNVISANDLVGVFLDHGATGTRVANNLIGTTADGLGAAGNGHEGVLIVGDGNLIGGPAGAGNVISANGQSGILINNAEFNSILGNDIGVGRDGQTILPNLGHGVELLAGARHNEIGGEARPSSQRADTANSGNRIVANVGHGISLRRLEDLVPTNNRIRRNEIFGNGGLGIDLGNDGVDSVDPLDGDTGENERQNQPQLATTAGSRRLEILLQSLPDTSFTIDLFRNYSCDPTGHGEGQDWLWSGTLMTDGSGQVTVEVDLPAAVAFGTALSATATHMETGNSSEFSNCAVLSAPEPAFALYLPLVTGP